MPTLTHIRTYKLTREKINNLADRWGVTQAEAVERILLSAESVNFDTEPNIKKIEKVVQKNVNRIIGFLKIQDKNLLQVQDNILYKNGGQHPPKNSSDSVKNFQNFLKAKFAQTEHAYFEALKELKQTNGRDDFDKIRQNQNQINSIKQGIDFCQYFKKAMPKFYEEFKKLDEDEINQSN